MEKVFIEGKSFENLDLSENVFPHGEYENCTFLNCSFAQADLSKMSFAECSFTGCNMSMAKLTNTPLRDIHFKDCKLLGLRFENCSPFLFAADFDNCILNLSSFYKLKLKKTRFNHCSLTEVDFTEADLSSALFTDCDLSGAIFDHTILEKADLRTAYHYTIDPEINRIKKARFSMNGIAGLLHKYDLDIE
jgi:fluoroquinolone resistance protein